MSIHMEISNPEKYIPRRLGYDLIISNLIRDLSRSRVAREEADKSFRRYFELAYKAALERYLGDVDFYRLYAVESLIPVCPAEIRERFSREISSLIILGRYMKNKGESKRKAHDLIESVRYDAIFPYFLPNEELLKTNRALEEAAEILHKENLPIPMDTVAELAEKIETELLRRKQLFAKIRRALTGYY